MSSVERDKAVVGLLNALTALVKACSPAVAKAVAEYVGAKHS